MQLNINNIVYEEATWKRTTHRCGKEDERVGGKERHRGQKRRNKKPSDQLK